MHHLRSDGASALIGSRGAELRAWSVGGRDLLWSPDAAVWDAVAPILFPVVGWTRGGNVRVGTETFPLGLHGFARHRDFAVAEAASDRIRLVDRADASSRGMYPFAYRLEIEFRLSPSSLACIAHVVNEDNDAMPYAIGFHPGFRWPSEAASHLVFDEDEASHVPVITGEGLFAPQTRPVPMMERILPLDADLLKREALCFLGLRSERMTYHADGLGRLHIAHENFPHLALWSRPPAPFLCIESWTGHGDPDDFAGELREKPSMRLLEPGDTARHAATYTFTPH